MTGKVLLWLRGQRTDPPTDQPHYGLFTIGPGDIIITKPLLDLILLRLRAGTLDERQDLAQRITESVEGMY